ncbi:unnamed protein product, partial [Amoebophrya sp. A120]|eukprot:GSA120T00006271001.1
MVSLRSEYVCRPDPVRGGMIISRRVGRSLSSCGSSVDEQRSRKEDRDDKYTPDNIKNVIEVPDSFGFLSPSPDERRLLRNNSRSCDGTTSQHSGRSASRAGTRDLQQNEDHVVNIGDARPPRNESPRRNLFFRDSTSRSPSSGSDDGLSRPWDDDRDVDGDTSLYGSEDGDDAGADQTCTSSCTLEGTMKTPTCRRRSRLERQKNRRRQERMPRSGRKERGRGQLHHREQHLSRHPRRDGRKSKSCAGFLDKLFRKGKDNELSTSSSSSSPIC